MDAGKMVLSPTRTYAPLFVKMLANYKDKIHGLVHCSGGGQTKVLHFVDKLHIVKDNLFETPVLFKMIQEESKTDWREMYQVFNMGHRMEAYTDSTTAEALIALAAEFNIDAKIVGRVEGSTEGKKLSLTSEHGSFTY